MTLIDKLTYIINKLKNEKYPHLHCYNLYKDSEYIATISTENEDNCLVYNEYMYRKPNNYYTKIDEVKVLEPQPNCFVIVYNEDNMYFVTF